MSTGLVLLALAALFLLGAPMAVAIGAAGLGALLLSGDAPAMLAVQRMVAGADSFPLMAVPLFMIAGQLMEAGGISRRMVDLADALVGWLPGGLAAVAVVAAMLFGGISGSAAADTAETAAAARADARKGYDPALAGAVQAAGGSIGVVIPPSIPMILFGVLTGASIGELFAAGLLPGLLMGLTLVTATTVLALHGGAPDARGRRFSPGQARQALGRAGWALGAPAIVLGGILGGVFNATESAAAAVVYALGTGLFVYRELTWRALPALFLKASVTAAVVMFLVAQAQVLAWVLAVQEAPATLAAWLLGLTTDPVALLLLVNAVLLVAGTFIETTAALVLLVPVLVPLLPHLGIGLVQLGAIVVVNLAIGMLTPPLGICLVVACGLSGARLGAVAARVAPLLLVLLADLLLISFWPPLTTALPALLTR